MISWLDLKLNQEKFEVERKFKLSKLLLPDFLDKLAGLAFKKLDNYQMTDYFLPVYANFDMVRIRQETGVKTKFYLTCKTWKVLTDGSRERIEEEEELSSKMGLILLSLVTNNSAIKFFTKTRDVFVGSLSGQRVTVCLDNVSNLGVFSGNYLEIEILVSAENQIPEARNSIDHLVKELLTQYDYQPMELSYFDMLKHLDD